jgi:cytochrome c556
MELSSAAISTLLAALILGAASQSAIAENATPSAEPLALQKVMKDLGKHMQTITDGISREDWALVEKTAPLIGEHPQPPVAEKTRIIGFMGSKMGKFKSYDGETHNAAHILAQAAKNGDGRAVINAFQTLQSSCYNCHQEFRKPFVKHFYGSQE